MFYSSQTVFKSNTVLKAELLQESSDYAFEMFHHIYEAYSDGIIEGVQVEIGEQELILHPGMLKYQGVLYHMGTPMRIPYEATGIPTYLKLRFHDVLEEEEHIMRTTEVILTEDGTSFPYEIELGRFTLEKGAVLHNRYQNFADLTTRYNRFNIVHVPYAGRGGVTVSPEITYRFGKELLAGNSGNVYDIAFAMNCVGKEAIDREVICLYLEKRLGRDSYKTYSNEQFYQTFVRVLKKPKELSGTSSVRRKVMVD